MLIDSTQSDICICFSLLFCVIFHVRCFKLIPLSLNRCIDYFFFYRQYHFSLSAHLQSLKETSSTTPDIEIGALNHILDGFRAKRIALVQSEWTRFGEDRSGATFEIWENRNEPGPVTPASAPTAKPVPRKFCTRSRVKDSLALTSAVLRSNEPLCGWRFEEYMHAYVNVHARILTHGWEHDKFLMAHAYTAYSFISHLFTF